MGLKVLADDAKRFRIWDICPLADLGNGKGCYGARIPAVFEVTCSRRYESCKQLGTGRPIKEGNHPLTDRVYNSHIPRGGQA